MYPLAQRSYNLLHSQINFTLKTVEQANKTLIELITDQEGDLLKSGTMCKIVSHKEKMHNLKV